MSGREDRMREDRRLRDAARALVLADVAHLKADLAHRSVGARAADRISSGASDVYDEAVDVARDHKGALAAILAALVVWFTRNPIMDALFGDSDADEDDFDDRDPDTRAFGDREFDDHDQPFPGRQSRGHHRR